MWHSEQMAGQAVQGILCTDTWLQLATADTDSMQGFIQKMSQGPYRIFEGAARQT